jgi:uncharacterized protein DUF6410
MLFKTEQRGFAVGQEVGSCGRYTRFVLGLLGLVYIGTSVVQMGPSATLLGQIAGGLLLTVVLYIVLFWALGERVPHPWLRTVIFWLPAVFILLPWGWGFGVLLYWSLACLLTALMAYGGCEVVALPSLLFRRYYTVYCPLNAIDLVERRYTQR